METGYWSVKVETTNLIVPVQKLSAYLIVLLRKDELPLKYHLEN